MTGNIEQFIKQMLQKGFDINTIRSSYIKILQPEDYEKILIYLSENESASKEDINYEIHKIHLKKRGIRR